LEYSSAVWSAHRIDLIKRLEDVQRRFTKKLNGLANLSYAKHLEILGLEALLTRRTKSDLVLCYSVVHGHSCMKPAHFFVLRSTYITRGRNLKLFKPQCSLNVRKYSFAYRVIDIWNSLSSDTVNANSISVFRHKLELVDFTPLCMVEFTYGLCVSLLCYFLLWGMHQCLSGPVCPDFLFTYLDLDL